MTQARQGHWPFLAGFVAGILAWSGSARAQSAAELAPFTASSWLSVSRWPGTERCPNREQLASAVRSRLTSAAAPSSDGLSVRVTLSAREGGLLALIELGHHGQPIGARQLASQDASCDELAQALAIVVALAIDVHSAGQRDAGALPSPPRELPDETPDDTEADEFLPLPADPSTRRPDTSLRLGGELTFGLMPHPQVGVSVGLCTLRTFIYGMCLRVASDYRRQRQRAREQPVETLPERAVPASQLTDVATRQALERLEQALERLPQVQREVFVLFELEELSMVETAQAMGCPLFTAYARLRSAHEALARELGEAWIASECTRESDT